LGTETSKKEARYQILLLPFDYSLKFVKPYDRLVCWLYISFYMADNDSTFDKQYNQQINKHFVKMNFEKSITYTEQLHKSFKG